MGTTEPSVRPYSRSSRHTSPGQGIQGYSRGNLGVLMGYSRGTLGVLIHGYHSAVGTAVLTLVPPYKPRPGRVGQGGTAAALRSGRAGEADRIVGGGYCEGYSRGALRVL